MCIKNWAICLLLPAVGYEYSMERSGQELTYEVIYRGTLQAENGQVYDVYDEIVRYAPPGVHRRNRGRLSHCLTTFKRTMKENDKLGMGMIGIAMGACFVAEGIRNAQQPKLENTADNPAHTKNASKFLFAGGASLAVGSWLVASESIKMVQECCRSLDDVE